MGNFISYKDINGSFRQFYESLYASYFTTEPQDMQEFLDKCDLPVLDQVDHKTLNAKITSEEINLLAY